MKHILLFNPSHKFGGSVQPRIELPQSLLTIATPLDRAGYQVKIIDQRIDRQWREHFSEELKKEPICVGITSMTGPQIRNGLTASRLVRQNGNIPVVWGGIHASLLPEQTLENENIDIIVEGEGEDTFLELAQALEVGRSLSEVKGIWYKKDGEIKNTGLRPFIDLNQQPPLSYHLVDVEKYLVTLFGRGHLSLETSRGCPLKCNYCYNTKVYNSTWRALSIDETIRRMKMLIDEYHVEGFILTDDNFFGNKERALNLFKRIRDEKLGITFSKVDGPVPLLAKLKDSELALLKESGCKALMMGVESGSPRILKMMRKQLDIQELLEFNKRLGKFDILPLYFFMMGCPTETYQELSQTISLYLKLIEGNKDAVAHMNIFTPFPGTGLFDISVEKGLKVPESLEEWVPFNYRNVNENAPWLSERKKKTIRMLHFATMLAEKRIFLDPYKKTNPLIVLVARIYHPIAKKRVEKMYYKFSIEIKLAEWLGLYPKQI